MPSPRPPLLTPAFARILVMQSLFGASQACYALLPKFLAVELAASPPQIGAVAAIYSALNVLLVPAVGVGVDRLGRRAFLLAGNAISMFASLAFVFVDSVGPAIFARGLQGIGFACVFIGASALVADYAPPQRLSHALALLTATMHGTAASVPLMVEPAAERWGWEPVFIAAGICAGLAFLLCLNVRNLPRDQNEVTGSGVGILELLARPVAWRIIFMVSMVGIAVAALLTFIQPFALERGIRRIAPFLVAYSAVAMAVRVFLGGVLDRVDRYWTTLIAVTGYAALLFLVALIEIEIGALVTLGALFGLVHGAYFPAFNAMVLQGSGEAERGKALAVANTGFNVGFAAGNFGLGYAAAAWGYAALYVIAGAGMMAAVVLLFVIPGSARWSLAQDPR